MSHPDDEDLAARLRAVGHALHGTHAHAAARSEVLQHLAAAERLLSEGTRRLRWYEAEPDGAHRARNRDLSPWSGGLNAAAPPMTLEVGRLGDDSPAMIGRVCLDRQREGPPGCVHGGVIAGLFDEIMGAAQRLNGSEGGVTGRLIVRYRALTPLGVDLVFRAWIADDRRSRILVKADCTTASGEKSADAEAIFMRPRG